MGADIRIFQKLNTVRQIVSYFKIGKGFESDYCRICPDISICVFSQLNAQVCTWVQLDGFGREGCVNNTVLPIII